MLLVLVYFHGPLLQLGLKYSKDLIDITGSTLDQLISHFTNNIKPVWGPLLLFCFLFMYLNRNGKLEFYYLNIIKVNLHSSY